MIWGLGQISATARSRNISARLRNLNRSFYGLGFPNFRIAPMQEMAYLNNQKELRGATHIIGMLLSTSRMHSVWSKKHRGRLTKSQKQQILKEY